MRIRPQNNFKTTLTSSIGPTDATIPLATPPVQTSGYMALEPNTANFEIIKYTGVSGNNLTGCVRGLSITDSSSETPVPANQLSHSAGRSVQMTDVTYYFEQLAAPADNQTWTGKQTFPQSGSANAPVAATPYGPPSDPQEYVVKQALDDAISSVVAGVISSLAVSKNGADPTLTININSGFWTRGNELVFFPGAGAVAVTALATNYVFLQENNTIGINTTGFPTTNSTPLATVTTNAVTITSVADNRAFLSIASDDQLITTQITYEDTIAIGDVVRFDTATGGWKLADATSSTNADFAFGVALDAGVATDIDKRVQIAGIVQQVNGVFGVGTLFLSNTPGQVSNIPGTYKKVIGFSPDGTILGLGIQQRIEVLSGTNTDTTTANFNESMTFFANTAFSAAQATTLSAGPTSNADALHTHALSKKLTSIVTPVTVTNTIVETDLANISIPANALGTNNAIKFKLYITDFDKSTAVGNSINLRLRYGATVVAIASVALAGTGNDTNFFGALEGILTNTGATNSQRGNIMLNTSELITGTSPQMVNIQGVGTGAEDSTGALTFRVTVEWGVALAANSITVSTGTVELITA